MGTPIVFLRGREARSRFGVSNTTFYDLIGKGLMPPCVRLGGRLVAWPEYEISAIAMARIAGKGDDDVKTLVKELVANRGKAMPAQKGGLQ